MICSGTGGKEIIIVIEAAGQKGERGRQTVGAWAGSVRVYGSRPGYGPEMLNGHVDREVLGCFHSTAQVPKPPNAQSLSKLLPHPYLTYMHVFGALSVLCMYK